MMLCFLVWLSMSSKGPAMELDRGEFKATEKKSLLFAIRTHSVRAELLEKNHVRNDWAEGELD